MLGKLRLGPRIGLAFAMVVVLLIAVSVSSLRALNGINGQLDTVLRQNYVKVSIVSEMQQEISLQARYARDAVITDDPARSASAMASIKQSRQRGVKLYDRLTPLMTSTAERSTLDKLLKIRTAYGDALNTFEKMVVDGQTAAARQHLLDKLGPLQDEYKQVMDTASADQEQSMAQASDAANGFVVEAEYVMAALSLVAILVAAVGGLVIARSITRPLLRAVTLADAVAAGDLTQRISADTEDEVGHLIDTLGKMNASLQRIVGEVRHASDSIATGAHQISAGNTDLSQRTEEQASNLEETAASMEQLNATVKTNADTARQAAQLAQSASAAAVRGGEVFGQVIATMEGITAASHKISEIITTIDGIAFQTNILALNAAVEAARAGEQGRGFAVVAGEVRILAQRSAEAAKQIKALISESVDKVDSGSKLVHSAGGTMNEIVTQVRHVTDLISEISSATIEQTSGISQVSDAVMQLDQVTQQNAALVEEAASAADSLNQQASELVDAVRFFKVA